MLSNILDGEEVVLTGITRRIVSVSVSVQLFSSTTAFLHSADFFPSNAFSTVKLFSLPMLLLSTVQLFQYWGIGIGCQKMAPCSSVFEPNPSHPLIAPQCYIHLWRVTFNNIECRFINRGYWRTNIDIVLNARWNAKFLQVLLQWWHFIGDPQFSSVRGPESKL